MNRRMIFPILLGVFGISVLMSLGFWQLARLEWKQGLLAEIDSRLSAAPVDLPASLDPVTDKYLSVKVSGEWLPGEIHVLSGLERVGAGFLIVAPFATDDGRTILIERGFALETAKNAERPLGADTVSGTYLIPNEGEAHPDRTRNIWIVRDVPAMAKELGTEQLYIVEREAQIDDGLMLAQVGANVPNNHLNYAITWFGFAAVWLLMTLYLLSRIKRRTV